MRGIGRRWKSLGPFRSWLPCCLIACWESSCRSAGSLRSAAELWVEPAGKVDFNREVRPILAKNCFACHGQDEAKRAKGLRLDRRESAVKPLKSGDVGDRPRRPRFQRADRSGSPRRTRRSACPRRKAGNRLTPAEVETSRALDRARGRVRPTLGLDRARSPAAPQGRRTSPGRATASTSGSSPGWRREGLKPSPEAERPHAPAPRSASTSAACRPRPRKSSASSRDQAPDAYEKAVDRFLDDPAYGERWARMWLDLARYADSAGYGSDPLRPNIWRYRDWVIDAFNRNLPFDQFTLEQIAGDLLPERDASNSRSPPRSTATR